MACCHLALCQGLLASLPPLLGQHHEPSGVWPGNLAGLSLKQTRRRALQHAQNWGTGLPVLPMRKGSFVNADILPECCIRENELEKLLPVIFKCSKPLLAPMILLGGQGEEFPPSEY